MIKDIPETDWIDEDLEVELILYQLSSLQTFLRLILGLLARAGFLIIQIGNIPTTNVSCIVFQNLVDIGVTSLAFFLIGFPLAFGDTFFGIFGYNKWIWEERNHEWSEDLILGWITLIIGSGIITTMTVGRMHPLGYTLIYLISAGLVHPLILHWTWHQDGWLRLEMLNHQLSFHDQGGGFICQVYGSIWACVGMLFLGRRIIRLSDLDETSLPSASPALILLGYILLTGGILAIPLPTLKGIRDTGYLDGFGPVGVNGIIAFATGLVGEIICSGVQIKTPVDYWTGLRCIRAGLAGVVLLLPGIDTYHPTIALLLSLLGTLLFVWNSRLNFKLASEDYCNILEVHLVPGLLGTLLAPIFAINWNTFLNSPLTLRRIGWQFFAIFFLTTFITLCALATLVFITCAKLLRNVTDQTCHNLAMKMKKICEAKIYARLFPIGSTSVVLQPGKHLIKSEINVNEIQINTERFYDSSTRNQLILQKQKDFVNSNEINKNQAIDTPKFREDSNPSAP